MFGAQAITLKTWAPPGRELREVKERRRVRIAHSRAMWLWSVNLCKLQNYAKCKSRQNAKICKVQNYVKCKIMQSAKLCKVQNYSRCKNMQGANLCTSKSIPCSATTWVLKAQNFIYTRGEYVWLCVRPERRRREGYCIYRAGMYNCMYARRSSSCLWFKDIFVLELSWF